MSLFQFLIGFLGQVGFFSWALLIGVLAWTIWKLKSMRGRAIATAVILGLFVAVPGRLAWESQKRIERYTVAEAMFKERCKKSGEFIHRTAENVEGIFLLKLRPKEINYGDQYKMDDPYGRDLGGDGYIESFIRGEFQATHKGVGFPGSPQYIGYNYVDALDPQDGKRYRYTGGMKAVGKQDPTAFNVKLAISKDPNYDLNIYSFVLDRIPTPDSAPRYGVTYDDISAREERDYWIAGSSLKVIDLKTKEVMAERVGYMMDRGQGSRSGGRSPWLMAADNACPEFFPRHGSTVQPYQTLVFVEKTLKPKMEK